jgi:hypothetical protein
MEHQTQRAPSAGSGPVNRRRQALLGAAFLLTLPTARLGHDIILADRLSLCPFRVVTGRPCPLCGLTRAFAHATCLEFDQAQAAHPLWAIAFVLVTLTGGSLLMDGTLKTNLSRRLFRVLGRLQIPLALVFVAFGIWRLVA